MAEARGGSDVAPDRSLDVSFRGPRRSGIRLPSRSPFRITAVRPFELFLLFANQSNHRVSVLGEPFHMRLSMSRELPFGFRGGNSLPFDVLTEESRPFRRPASSSANAGAREFIYVITDGTRVKIECSRDPMARLGYLEASVNDDLEMAYVAAAKDDVRAVVSAAFAILAKYRQSDGWFYVSDEIAVAAIATGAFRTGELIVQVPLCLVGQVVAATRVPRRSIGNIVGAGAILLVKSSIALLVALAAIAAGILFAIIHAMMRHR
jgi:hypothetical protein